MSLVIEDRTCFSGFCPCLYLRDHMKGRIDYCILEILKPEKDIQGYQFKLKVK